MRVQPWVVGGAISAFFAGIVVPVVATSVAACSSTTTTVGVVPVTGITISAATLTSGLGCGTGPGQVYKYAAVVSDPTVGAVYDCFADAAFVNLVSQVDGGFDYTVQVFLYDKAAYDANASQINGAVGASNAIAVLSQIPSTFTTSCTASETLNIQTVAHCNPVTSGGPGSLQILTDSFPLTDGGKITCGAGYTQVINGALDGGILLDAGDASTAQCPGPLTLGPFPAFAAAAAPVTLLNGQLEIASTTCRATIAPGGATAAACDPLNLP